MSRRATGKGADAKGGAAAQTAGAAAGRAVPLKPRPRLFVALLVGFAVWLGGLLLLYFKTVYPQRHPSAATTRPGASVLPSAPR